MKTGLRREASLLILLVIIAGLGCIYLARRPSRHVGFKSDQFDSEVHLRGDSLKVAADFWSVKQSLTVPSSTDSIKLMVGGGGGIRVLCSTHYDGGNLLFTSGSKLLKMPFAPTQNLHAVAPASLSRVVVSPGHFEIFKLTRLSETGATPVPSEWMFVGTLPIRTHLAGEFRDLRYRAGSLYAEKSLGNPSTFILDAAVKIISISGFQLGPVSQNSCSGAGDAVLQLFGGARLYAVDIYAPNRAFIALEDYDTLHKGRSDVYVSGIDAAAFPRLRRGHLTVGQRERQIGGLHHLTIMSASAGRVSITGEQQETEYEDSAAHVILSGENLTPRLWEEFPGELLAVAGAGLLTAIGFLVRKLLRIEP